jgi:OOP family OmpA-OmpF porin
MKRFLMTLILASVFMATSAQAEKNKWYFAAQGGASLTDDFDLPGLNISFNTGYNLGGALGYDMGKFRVEGEITYRSVDIDTVNGVSFPLDASLSALTFMANGYYDFEMDSLTPYIGVGLGVADSEIEVSGFSAVSETDFAYQFMAGLAFNVSKTAYLTAGYRFFVISETDAPNSHEFTLGARFMF